MEARLPERNVARTHRRMMAIFFFERSEESRLMALSLIHISSPAPRRRESLFSHENAGNIGNPVLGDQIAEKGLPNLRRRYAMAGNINGN